MMAVELIFHCMQTNQCGPIEILNNTHSRRCSFYATVSHRVMLLVLLVLLLVTQHNLYAAQWVRASSDHFKLTTDASAGSARNIIRRFEEIRQVLVPLAVSVPALESPVPVLGLTSASEVTRFRTTGRE